MTKANLIVPARTSHAASFPCNFLGKKRKENKRSSSAFLRAGGAESISGVRSPSALCALRRTVYAGPVSGFCVATALGMAEAGRPGTRPSLVAAPGEVVVDAMSCASAQSLSATSGTAPSGRDDGAKPVRRGEVSQPGRRQARTRVYTGCCRTPAAHARRSKPASPRAGARTRRTVSVSVSVWWRRGSNNTSWGWRPAGR